MKSDKKPKVSVVTVCYNAAENLQKTMLSVKEQSYENLEYIIVDGGSKDESVDIIKQYGEVVCRWISEPDNGIYDAMNKGVDFATGEWIIFMNAGDVFMTADVLNTVFARQIPNEVGVIYGDVCLDYSPYGKVVKRMNGLKGKNEATDICHQSSFTRAVLLKANPYDLSYKIASDMNTFHKLWMQGIRFMYVPECISCFEAFSGVSSTRYLASFRERTRIQGICWYNSLYWWSYYFRSIGKTVIQKCLPLKIHEKYLYNRISKQNGPQD